MIETITLIKIAVAATVGIIAGDIITNKELIKGLEELVKTIEEEEEEEAKKITKKNY